jgi:hypothetical protein
LDEANGVVAGVRSPPLQGWTVRARMALRGSAGDDARGGFLGGARSPRPGGKAGRKARHNIIIGGKRRAGGRTGPCLSEARVIRTGVRSPPLQGWTVRARMALRGSAGDDAKGDFLGGTHSVRPHGKDGLMPRHNIIIGGKRRAGGRTGPCLSEARVIRTGVRSPPLRRGAKPRVRWPRGERPRDGAEGGCLGGARSPRPRGKDGLMPRHNIIIGGKRRAGGRTGPCLSEARVIRTGVRSPPLRGGPSRG